MKDYGRRLEEEPKSRKRTTEEDVQDDFREQEGPATEKRRGNREYTFVSAFFILIFLSLIGYLVWFNVSESDDFINSPYNTRQDTFSDRVVRGNILSSDGEILAQTYVYEDGTEQRVYPYGAMFAHVVGFDTHGKSGLESEVNFHLLSSHEFFIDQIKNEYHGRKNQGDNVITSLSVPLQMTAYNALGDRRGAIIAMEPKTGRILCMVSKPDFDPNYLDFNWDNLVSDANDSSLLNRVTNGAYPPGSTFKLVTALDYFRKKGTLEGYSYLCEGTITQEDHTIHCYKETAHGPENLYSAFANSCNCAFAEIGTDLGGSSLRQTAEDLLFNKKLPFDNYRKSTFSLTGSSPVPLVMQTSIGQGNTLVSPAHMALLACAVANEGTVMKPTLVDSIRNSSGDTVRTYGPSVYKRVMSLNEANLLGKLMQGVVQNGTASALNGRGYTSAGKTGSAEYDEDGSSHSWFIGYANAEDPDIALAVIVEGGGTGSDAAVPIAAAIFDQYYSLH